MARPLLLLVSDDPGRRRGQPWPRSRRRRTSTLQRVIEAAPTETLIDMGPSSPASWPRWMLHRESGTIGNGTGRGQPHGSVGPGAYAATNPASGHPRPDREGSQLEPGWFLFPGFVEGGAGVPSTAWYGDGFALARMPHRGVLAHLRRSPRRSGNRAVRRGPLFRQWGAEVIQPIRCSKQLRGWERRRSSSYLDQYFSPELGAAVNDAVATLFAGTATPEEVD